MAVHKAPPGFYDWIAGFNTYPEAVLDGLYSVFWAIENSPPVGGQGTAVVDAINAMSDRLHADLLQQIVDIVNAIEGLEITLQNGIATLSADIQANTAVLEDIKTNQTNGTQVVQTNLEDDISTQTGSINSKLDELKANQTNGNQVVQTNLEDDISTQTNALVAAIEQASISPIKVFEYRLPPAASLPSGSVPTIHPVLNTESNVIDSGWYLVSHFAAGQFLNFVANRAAKIFLLNAEDATGNNMVGNTTPFLTPAADRAVPFGAPYFDKYSRIVIVNDSGSTCTALSILANGLFVEKPAIYTPLDQPIFDEFPARLGQTVIKAKRPSGVYSAINADSNGNLLVASTPTAFATYSVGAQFDCESTPTDIFTITGSATKTILVTKIRMSFSTTAEQIVNVAILRRSAANTGGVSTTPQPIRFDTNNAVATAVVRAYTLDPLTLGTLVGTIREQKLTSVATPVKIQNIITGFEFGTSIGTPFYLRGTSQVMAVNLKGNGYGSMNASIDIEWIEI